MTLAEIRQILQVLPADSPFYNRGGICREAKTPQDRLRVAYFDLNFGWRLAHAYHAADEPLPAFVEQPSVRRCYFHVAGIPDAAISEARFLDEQNTTQSRLLRSLLFARDASCESIAGYLKLSDGVVRLYADLFFNVHDRLDDPIFIAQHLYPETRAIHLRPDYLQQESPEWIMRRLAYEHGWRIAAQFAGSEPLDESGPSLEQQAETLERLAISNGTLLARAGCLNSQESPAINHAKAFVTARRKGANNSRSPIEQSDCLTKLSLADGAMATLRQMVTADAWERLQAQQKLMQDERSGSAAR